MVLSKFAVEKFKPHFTVCFHLSSNDVTMGSTIIQIRMKPHSIHEVCWFRIIFWQIIFFFDYTFEQWFRTWWYKTWMKFSLRSIKCNFMRVINDANKCNVLCVYGDDQRNIADVGNVFGSLTTAVVFSAILIHNMIWYK